MSKKNTPTSPAPDLASSPEAREDERRLEFKPTLEQRITLRLYTGGRRSESSIADAYEGRGSDRVLRDVGITARCVNLPTPPNEPTPHSAPGAPHILYACECFGALGIRQTGGRYDCGRCGAPVFVGDPKNPPRNEPAAARPTPRPVDPRDDANLEIASAYRISNADIDAWCAATPMDRADAELVLAGRLPRQASTLRVAQVADALGIRLPSVVTIGRGQQPPPWASTWNVRNT